MKKNLCETCIYFKPRNTKNCEIQQSLHVNDIVKQITSIIIKCKKYKSNENI